MHKTINIKQLVEATHIDFSTDKEIQESVRSVLDWVLKIQNVDTTGVEPMFNTLEKLGLQNIKADARIAGVSFERLSSNTINKQDSFFLVPKVIR